MSGERPPKVLQVLAQLLIHGPDREFVIGDLEELYAAQSQATPGWRLKARFIAWCFRSSYHGAGPRLLSGLARDLQSSVRQFRNHPRVYLTATLVLALGMGVAAFSWGVYYGGHLRDLPIPGADRVVEFSRIDVESRARRSGFSPVDGRDLREVFPDLQHFTIWHRSEVHLNDVEGPPVRLPALRTSPGLFELLGLVPQLGRTFGPEDSEPGATRVAILGHSLWRDRYGGTEEAVGSSIRINGVPHVVVGVLRQGDRFIGDDPLWVPSEAVSLTEGGQMAGTSYSILGQLPSRDALEDVAARVSRFAAAKRAAGDPTWDGLDVRVDPFGTQFISNNAARTMRVITSSGALLLVLALANVSNLFLVRSQVRAHELGIRRALGAGRSRILRQTAAEAAVPALLGFAGALVVATYGLAWYRRAAFAYGGTSPIWVHYGLEGFHIGVLAVLALCSTVVVAVLGSVRGLREPGASARYSGQRVRGNSFRLGRGLLAVQVGVGGTLLLLAFTLLHSSWNLRTIDWGFTTETVLTGEVVLEGAEYDTPDERAAMFAVLEQELSAIPGVESATLATLLPMIRYRGSRPIEVEGWEYDDPRSLPRHYADFVTPSFFETFQKPLLSGRGFTTADGADSEPVAIVNEDFARRFYGQESPLGKVLRVWEGDGPGPWRTVVGVAPHLWMDTDVNERPEGVYLPLAQTDPTWVQFAIRVREDPSSYAMPLRAAIETIDPDLPVIDLRTMPELIRSRTRLYRFQSPPLIAVGLSALILAIVGLYAVASYLASLRTAELGIRAALGARRFELMRRAASAVLLPTAIGALGALGGGLALVQDFDRMIFNSDPWNPVTLTVALGALVLACIVSSLLPAIAASRIDLVRVLSSD